MVNFLLLIGVYGVLASHIVLGYYYVTKVHPKVQEIQKVQERFRKLFKDE